MSSSDRRPVPAGLTLLMILLGGICSTSAAQQEPGYYFLRLPPSAHAAAVGNGATTASSHDIHQFLYNPAVLSSTHHRRVGLSYVNHLGDISAGAVAYGHHLSGVGTLGGGIRYLGYGSLERTGITGETTGSFTASDAAVSLGFGRNYSENFRIGATGHAIFSTIASSRATALAIDAGILYHYAPFDLTVGASVNNLGGELSGMGAADTRLPLDVRVSVTKQLEYVPLLLSLTGYGLNEIQHSPFSAPGDLLQEHVRLGGILQLTSAFELRFGYNPRRHRAMKIKSRLDLAGLSVGFGLSVFRVKVDYAYESWSSFGGLHYLTVGTQL